MKKSNVLTSCYLFPHPPIIVPEVGQGGEAAAHNTIESFDECAQTIAQQKPETIVFISPHAPLFSDFLFYFDDAKLSGSFERYGAAQVSFSENQNLKLVKIFAEILDREHISAGSLSAQERARYKITSDLEHGVLVPLYFIRKYYTGFNIFILSCSAFEPLTVVKIGELLLEAIEQEGSKTCIIASGDMSHKVNKESPYGMVKEGAAFDTLIAHGIKNADYESIVTMDQSIRVRAGECGYNSILMLLGVLHWQERQFSSRLLSYEAPFGIGYVIAEFLPLSIPVKIVRAVIYEFIGNNRVLSLIDLPTFKHNKAGCFVTIYKKGELRGCIGTISPTENSIVEEIQSNAIKAATKDPRFSTLQKHELNDITFSVDILDDPEPIQSKDELNPQIYGVIVSAGYRRGLLLPMLETVDTVEYQLEIACRKAGIDPNEPYTMQRFKVTRYR